MNFIEPMYAATMPAELNIDPRDYIWEEKWDGFRVIAYVDFNSEVKFWSRYGNLQFAPLHIRQAMQMLPPNSYFDGEFLVPGLRSYGARELVNRPNLEFVIFDTLKIRGVEVQHYPYHARQSYLKLDFDRLEGVLGLKYPGPTKLKSIVEIPSICEEIWARDGEGIILKQKNSPYTSGKRPKHDWIKIKNLRSEALTIVGFMPTRGTVLSRGSFAMVVLQDKDGIFTVVKTRNDEELRKLERLAPKNNPEEFTLGSAEPNTRDVVLPGGKKIRAWFTNHPMVGKKLRIEFQERTPDLSYRHPRWDRYEEQ